MVNQQLDYQENMEMKLKIEEKVNVSTRASVFDTRNISQQQSPPSRIKYNDCELTVTNN